MKERNQGIVYIIIAALFFALMTFFVRISGDLPTMEKAFFRNIVAVIVAAIALIRSKTPVSIPKGERWAMFFRCFFGTCGLICNFYAIDRMNIADANILNKLSPFFAIIMSYFVLKEKASGMEWASIVVAFAGALLVVKPSFQIEFVYGMIGVFGGFSAGAAYTFVRKMGQNGVPGALIVFCFSFFSSIVIAPFLILNYVPINGIQLLTLLAAGVCASVGQFAITKAYTCAPAKEISVFDYSQVIFAAILGFFFLGQVPDIWSIFGYVIIIGSAFAKWFYLNRKQPG